MDSKKFQRKIEDFECEHCGAEVKGNGYTNHCPKCLWSKHVDVNPGDRAEVCGGMMEPIEVEKRGEEFFIIHKCVKCGFRRANIAEQEDDFDLLVKIASGR